MNYLEYGDACNPTIILLHGGGLAPWNYFEEAKLLQYRYHVVLPVIDGHSGSDKDFTTIENNADEILSYIDKNCNGKVLMICGLSLGGQILVDLLARRKNICKFAIVESTLVLPMKATNALIQPIISMCYPLIKTRWFAQAQFKALHIKGIFFEDYFRGSIAITKENLLAFMKANSDYRLKESIKETNAAVLILVGSKESAIMKKSAKLLCEQIPDATLEILPQYYHGDLSINHSAEYVQKIDMLISER